MSVQLTPLGANLLLELEPEPEMSKIISVQKSLVDLVRYATVISVGPEVRDTKPGDRVVASVTAGTELPWGMLVNEKAVLSHVV